MKEIWKSVVGYEGLYRVSNLGRVLSQRRVLSPGIDTKGYRYVVLTRNKSTTNKLVGKLVLEAFKGLGNGLQVDHRDRVRTNDNLSNLRWATRSVNCRNRSTTLNSISGHVGVRPHGRKWRADGYKDGKSVYLGLFYTIKEAARAVRNFK